MLIHLTPLVSTFSKEFSSLISNSRAWLLLVLDNLICEAELKEKSTAKSKVPKKSIKQVLLEREQQQTIQSFKLDTKQPKVNEIQWKELNITLPAIDGTDDYSISLSQASSQDRELQHLVILNCASLLDQLLSSLQPRTSEFITCMESLKMQAESFKNKFTQFIDSL
ncbi:hypothetical protein GEMRC1_003279 [Eukaryota sp. GEM-RC1]